MATLESYYDEHPEARPKPTGHRGEHSLQVHIKGLVREYVATPHLFQAHDRSENRSGTQHLWEKRRGVEAGWPDVEIPLMGGRTFRCELKSLGKKPTPVQLDKMAALNALEHPTSWADSAAKFVTEARVIGGVQFRAGVDRRAAEIDASLAEAARQHKAAKPSRPSKPRVTQATSAAKRVAAAFYRR